MQPEAADISKGALWTGRILSGFATVFLVMDGGMKVFKPPFIVQANVKLGYPESDIVGIGITLLACTLLYVIPRTTMLGALLLTGYLGGAVATNVRAGTGWFNTLFPIGFAVVIWLGVWLRDSRFRAVAP